MSINTILSGITGISSGGKNTAAEFRTLLTDMTESLSATTDSGTTSHITDSTIHFEQSGITINKSQVSDFGNYLTGYTETDSLDSVTSRGNTTTNDIRVNSFSANTIQINNINGLVGDGLLSWNDEFGTANLGMKGGNVTLQVGQEMYIYGRAEGSDLVDGDVVYATGVHPASGRITVSKFIADGSIDELYLVGVVTESITNNGYGFITTFGVIHDMDTSEWDVGTILYASDIVPGKLTSVIPIPPRLRLSVAIVLRSHNSLGSIMIRPRIGVHISEIHNVGITGATNGDYLKYNGSKQVWENVTLFSPTPSTSGDTGTINQIAYDNDYMYICIETNTWKRTPLSGW